MAKGLTVKIRADASQFDKTMRGVRGGIRRVSGPLKAVGVAAAAAGAAIIATGVAAVALARKLIEIGEGANTASARTANAVRQMGLFGDAAKTVSDRLDAVATSTALQTGVDKKSIQMTQAKLATFEELLKTADETGGAFDRVTLAAINLSAAGFGSAEQNAVQLGKAFADVESGLTALRRTGTLTRQQIESISQEFKKSGDQAKAFESILQALERQSKDSASVTANGTARIATAWQMVKEEVGKPMAAEFGKFADDIANSTPKIIAAVEAMGPKIAEASRAIMTSIADAIGGDFAKIAAIGEFLGEVFAKSFWLSARAGMSKFGSSIWQGLDKAENAIRGATRLDRLIGQSNMGDVIAGENKLYRSREMQVFAKEISAEFGQLVQRLNYDPNYRVQTGGGHFRQAVPGESSMFSDSQGRALVEIKNTLERIDRKTPSPQLFPAQ